MIISKSLEEIITKLKQGKVICFKTDTIWGFSADGTNLNAMQHLCDIKQRDINRPVIFLIKKGQDLTKIVKNVPPQAEKLISQFWCGPLTLIFEARDDFFLPYKNNRTISLRMPNDPLTQQILNKFDMPLPSTSVNIEGNPALNSFEEITSAFSSEDFYILSPSASLNLNQNGLLTKNLQTENMQTKNLQANNTEETISQTIVLNKNVSSTIVSCVNNKIEILREGSISKQQIEDCLKQK